MRLTLLATLYFGLIVELGAQQITSLAILDFEARGIAAHEAASLTDWLRSEIVGIGEFPIVERGDMMAVLVAEQDLQLTGCTSDDCAIQIGQLLGVSHMVVGSFGKVGTIYTILSRLIDVETGQIMIAANRKHQGSIEGLFNEMTSLAYEIVGQESNWTQIQEAKRIRERRTRHMVEQAKQEREQKARQKIEDDKRWRTQQIYTFGILIVLWFVFIS